MPIHDKKTRSVQKTIFKQSQATLTIGSVCSGLCTDALVGKNVATVLSKELVVSFCCDNDKSVKAYAEQNAEALRHQRWYDDVLSKDFQSTAGYVDVFSAGFPCQPWSTEGKMLGQNDDRSAPMSAITKYIRSKQPSVFILENVSGILHQKHAKARVVT
jgi:site-specific DNA-cytosine methylase